MEKKVYETPEVTKVEYDASDRITASSCSGETFLALESICNKEP